MLGKYVTWHAKFQTGIAVVSTGCLTYGCRVCNTLLVLWLLLVSQGFHCRLSSFIFLCCGSHRFGILKSIHRLVPGVWATDKRNKIQVADFEPSMALSL